MRRCLHPTCAALISSGSRCPEHARKPFTGAGRDMGGRPWRAIRARVLKRDGGVCQVPSGSGICGAPANTVDHIVPASRGGDDGDANLRAACARCNHRLGSSLGGRR